MAKISQKTGSRHFMVTAGRQTRYPHSLPCPYARHTCPSRQRNLGGFSPLEITHFLLPRYLVEFSSAFRPDWGGPNDSIEFGGFDKAFLYATS